MADKTFASWLAENVLALALIGTSIGATFVNYNTRQALTEQGLGQYEKRLSRVEEQLEIHRKASEEQRVNYASERAEMRTLLVGVKESVEANTHVLEVTTAVVRSVHGEIKRAESGVAENRRRLDKLGG